jgi:TPR repeat protein
MAAKFLWKAVGKENPSAILLLSDMYLIGDGVPKSCDQARLLLTAATRKGVPQAAQKLRNLLRSGCR